jgi:hypothetical protein
MKRYEDATLFLTRLIEAYPGSAVAEVAAKEKASINGMKNFCIFPFVLVFCWFFYDRFNFLRFII